MMRRGLLVAGQRRMWANSPIATSRYRLEMACANGGASWLYR